MSDLENEVLQTYEKLLNMIPEDSISSFKTLLDKKILNVIFLIYKFESNLSDAHTSFLNRFYDEESKFTTFELKEQLPDVSEEYFKENLYSMDLFESVLAIDQALMLSGNPKELTYGASINKLLHFIGMCALKINSNNYAGYNLLNSYNEAMDKWLENNLGKIQKREFEKINEKKESLVSLEELMQEFDNLIGLSNLKKDIKNLVNLMKVRKLRIEQNLPVPPISFHLVFTGNPGTGKTTVARLVAKIYQSLGVISKGQLVEVDRSGLVAGYVGQTAIKVKEVVEKSLGGVLFIDEAYSLTSSNNDRDYGKEAIETLLKCMEDYRNDFVVIVAGYPTEMEEFLNSNPGLKSRFNKFFEFKDYDALNLQSILEKMCEEGGYQLTEEANAYAASLFQFLVSKKTKNFGNGRVVRNIFEKIISYQANRVVEIANPSIQELSLIERSDMEKIKTF